MQSSLWTILYTYFSFLFTSFLLSHSSYFSFSLPSFLLSYSSFFLPSFLLSHSSFFLPFFHLSHPSSLLTYLSYLPSLLSLISLLLLLFLPSLLSLVCLSSKFSFFLPSSMHLNVEHDSSWQHGMKTTTRRVSLEVFKQSSSTAYFFTGTWWSSQLQTHWDLTWCAILDSSTVV